MDKDQFLEANVRVSEEELVDVENTIEHQISQLVSGSHGYDNRTLGLVCKYAGGVLLEEIMKINNLPIDDVVVNLEEYLFRYLNFIKIRKMYFEDKTV